MKSRPIPSDSPVLFNKHRKEEKKVAASLPV